MQERIDIVPTNIIIFIIAIMESMGEVVSVGRGCYPPLFACHCHDLQQSTCGGAGGGVISATRTNCFWP